MRIQKINANQRELTIWTQLFFSALFTHFKSSIWHFWLRQLSVRSFTKKSSKSHIWATTWKTVLIINIIKIWYHEHIKHISHTICDVSAFLLIQIFINVKIAISLRSFKTSLLLFQARKIYIIILFFYLLHIMNIKLQKRFVIFKSRSWSHKRSFSQQMIEAKFEQIDNEDDAVVCLKCLVVIREWANKNSYNVHLQMWFDYKWLKKHHEKFMLIKTKYVISISSASLSITTIKSTTSTATSKKKIFWSKIISRSKKSNTFSRISVVSFKSKLSFQQSINDIAKKIFKSYMIVQALQQISDVFYTCRICKVIFNFNNNLHKHIRVNHQRRTSHDHVNLQ